MRILHARRSSCGKRPTERHIQARTALALLRHWFAQAIGYPMISGSNWIAILVSDYTLFRAFVG